MLQELRNAGLMANPNKWSLGQEDTQYLGFRVEQGHVQPLADKVATI